MTRTPCRVLRLLIARREVPRCAVQLRLPMAAGGALREVGRGGREPSRRPFTIDEEEELAVGQMVFMQHVAHLLPTAVRRVTARVSDFATDPSEISSVRAMSR